MLLIWSGRGLWALLILLIGLTVSGVGMAVAADRFPSITASPYFSLPLALGLATGGAVCWVLGRRWNAADTSGLGHSLYFLPVEYWGVIAVVGAAITAGRTLAM